MEPMAAGAKPLGIDDAVRLGLVDYQERLLKNATEYGKKGGE